MEKTQPSYHALVSKIMIIALLIPAVAPLYLLWTQTGVEIYYFIRFVILCFVVMVVIGSVSLYLHAKASDINKMENDYLQEKANYYESFIERGHRIARAFFNDNEKAMDNKNTKTAWFLMLVPLPLTAYSPVILLMMNDGVPFYIFSIYLLSTFILSICIGWFAFQLYKKVAVMYEKKKMQLLKDNIKDSDINQVETDSLKELSKMWKEVLTDDDFKASIEKEQFQDFVKEESMYKDFIKNWKETLETEKEMNLKMAFQLYFLLEYISDK